MLGTPLLLALLPQLIQAESVLKPLDSDDIILYSLATLGLVFFGGCMSGLNVGMLTLDEFELEQIVSSGTEQEKRYAKKIIPLVSKHHWLLVSILLGNAIAAETLPICLSQMMHESLAIIFSVIFVLVCGEIIPQAFLTGPSQLKIAAFFVPLVKLVMILTLPVSYPMAKVLDLVLGENEVAGQNLDLKQMVMAHQVVSKKSGIYKKEISNEQYKIIHGALDIHKHMVSSCTLPMADVFALSYNTILTDKVLNDVRSSGFSRIPVYYGNDPSSASAILLSKRLIGFNTHEFLSIESGNLDLRKPLFVYPDENLLELLNKFQAGHVHMAFVCKKLKGLDRDLAPTRLHCIGIITLEDVIEKLLMTEIDDEFDYDILNSAQKKESIANFESLKVKRRLGLRNTSWRKLNPDVANFEFIEEKRQLQK